jgi:predicted nucleotidyltransferase
MKTVAIICEYNPFHTGHKYHIDKLRNEFGSDTRIVAVMSGNFTQRGEVAFADKYLRAKCAVLSGVNLVLELPFPFSSSSAEFFAKSALKIVSAIPNVDYLSFGSESGDLSHLSKIAENMIKEPFLSLLKSNEATQSQGYAASIPELYNSCYQPKLPPSFFSPNNILAIEYIKAINELSLNITPHTIKRMGASYSDEKLTKCTHQSAAAIRNLMIHDKISALEYLPKSSKDVLISELESFPCDIERISSAIISYFRLNTPEGSFHDADGGLYNRISKYSFETDSISHLISLSDTKKYTSARIRRAILNSFFGVTSSNVRKLPLYTQLLGADSVGTAILKDAKEYGKLPILTKPSRKSILSDEARLQKELSDRADSIFQLTHPNFTFGHGNITATPFIMKNSAKD